MWIGDVIVKVLRNYGLPTILKKFEDEYIYLSILDFMKFLPLS